MPVHYRTCNLCEAMCGLKIEYQGRKVLRIQGDAEDPFSRGHICPKAVALQDIYSDPDRLRQPLRKTSDGWQTISWEAAFELAAEGLQQVQARHGKDAVGVYQGNPNAHNFGTLLFAPDFVRALGTKNRFSATSVDQLPHHFAARLMYGHYLQIPIPDIDRTQFLLILGANPLVSNGSLMTAPDVANRLKAIQARGGKIVVVDPRRTETATKADQHLFIRPGTDAWLLLAMIHTLVHEQRVNLGKNEAYVEGLEAVEAMVPPFTPEAAAQRTGIAADSIRQLAREFSQAEAAVCYGRLGVSVQEFGGLCQWLVNLLNLLTGNLDKPGGSMFTLPAFDLVGQTGAAGKTGGLGRWQSRIRGLPELAGELPVSELADEILTPGEGQIRGMVSIAGNPVLSTPDGQKLDKAFSGLEFMLSIDIYLNETTRHADLILPPTTGLETLQYDLLFNLFSIRNTAKYSPPLFEKTTEQRHDWEIFQALSKRLGGKDKKGLRPEFMLDFALKAGPYDLDFERLSQSPHGVDLGPLQPCLPGRLYTPGKRINLAPEAFLEDLKRLTQGKHIAPGQQFPLRLIGRRQLRSNNSWMHNSQRLVKGKARCTVLIHPRDAQVYGIQEEQQVRVSSENGSVELPAEISDEVMPGIVSIPHGWGHNRPGIQLHVASRHAGVSINDLTDTGLIDRLTGNAALNGVPVKIAAIIS